MRAVRPNALALVDSFAYPDYQLNSALGRKDGNVYQVGRSPLPACLPAHLPCCPPARLRGWWATRARSDPARRWDSRPRSNPILACTHCSLPGADSSPPAPVNRASMAGCCPCSARGPCLPSLPPAGTAGQRTHQPPERHAGGARLEAGAGAAA